MASTTIVPFSSLPACASSCGPLYDVNGACVPPAAATAAATAYEECFCSDTRLVAFSTATAGPCDAACTATPADFGSITSWYKSMCSSVQALEGAVSTSTNSDGSTSTSTSTADSSSGGGGWISSHWQWVIFIVVMVVGIAGIWIGAALWRRNYIRKKDRQYALGKNLARRTGSGQNPYGRSMTPTRSSSLMQSPGGSAGGRPGAFMQNGGGGSNGAYNEKSASSRVKRWFS